MPLSRNLGQYNDVRDVLDLALANGGGRYTLSSRKAAIRWRQRAYMYRSLLREDLEIRRKELGFTVVTPYDEVLITIDDNVAILTMSKMEGIFEPLHGGPTVQPASAPADDLDAEAAALAKELGL